MIRVIGIDIPRGWAVVDVQQGFIGPKAAMGQALGELDEASPVEHFAELVRKYQVGKAAIETPLEPYLFGRGSKGNGEGVRRAVIVSLMKCARLAGRMEQQAIVMGLPVVVTDADEVRKALGISGKTRVEKDQSVKQYVMTHVRGWPSRTNADERDAACVAVHGGQTKIVEVKR